MGRIAEALRSGSVDSVGLPKAADAQDLSPWRFEDAWPPHRADPGRSDATDSLPEPVAPPPACTRAHERGRRGGVDTGAIEGLVTSTAAGPLLVEQFRSLAATLHRAQRERPLRSLVVTSTAPGDGKSHVPVNLSLTLSDSFRRHVLLIDADLRRPSLHRLFGVTNSHGLGDTLRAETDEEIRTVPITENLMFLPAGRPDSSPLGGLSSDRMKRIVLDGTSRFDWVIVDSPPAGVLADARLVAEALDAVILVVKAGVTRCPDLQDAIDAIGHDRILGIVLNAVDPAEIRARHYYGHYYGHLPGERR